MVCVDNGSAVWIVDVVDEARARRMASAPNVTASFVRQRKTKKIVRLVIRDFGGNYKGPRRGNPRQYSHDHETRDNPPRVWTFKRLGFAGGGEVRPAAADGLGRA